MKTLWWIVTRSGTAAMLLCGYAAVLPWAPPVSATFSPSLRPDPYARAIDRASRLSQIRSLLISIDGKLVAERYFHGAGPSQWSNVKSVSKSIISTLAGIAIDGGYLKGVRDPIGEYFPQDLRAVDDIGKKMITIEDLLTMRSGLETTSNRNYGKWVQSGNWVRYALTRPMVDVPGGQMIYSTGNTHLLSAVLTKATGISTFDFARRNLADPLGVPIRPWLRDPQGIYFGGNEMHFTPRGMLKIGELYINRGRAGNKQVVSATWIDESLKPRARSQRSGRQYGYLWWIDKLAGHQSYFAWGHSGQFIFLVPDLRMVAVTTSAASTDREQRREHHQAIYNLMEEAIIPAAKSGNTAEHSKGLDRSSGQFVGVR